jgi:hypothetical protein
MLADVGIKVAGAVIGTASTPTVAVVHTPMAPTAASEAAARHDGPAVGSVTPCWSP